MYTTDDHRNDLTEAVFDPQQTDYELRDIYRAFVADCGLGGALASQISGTSALHLTAVCESMGLSFQDTYFYGMDRGATNLLEDLRESSVIEDTWEKWVDNLPFDDALRLRVEKDDDGDVYDGVILVDLERFRDDLVREMSGEVDQEVLDSISDLAQLDRDEYDEDVYDAIVSAVRTQVAELVEEVYAEGPDLLEALKEYACGLWDGSGCRFDCNCRDRSECPEEDCEDCPETEEDDDEVEEDE